MSGRGIFFKILTAGDGGVGKTTLLHRYVDGKFLEDLTMTIGVQFFLKELDTRHEDNKLTLQLWDFGGQDQFHVLHEKYAQGASGALLMFDLTRNITLKNLGKWIDICRKEDPNLPIIFIGTKSDLGKNVDDEYILEQKEKYNLFDYIETSSKTGENVNEAFEKLAQKILELRF